VLLNYKQQGQGPHVILIHGLFGSLENLNVIAKPLSEYFNVINVDLRNHGLSPHYDEMNYPAMAQDIIDLMLHLNIENAHMIGHSMGGKVAMELALTHPGRVNKLVVLDIAPVAYTARHTKILQALRAVDNESIEDRKQADSIMSPYIEELGVRQFLLKSLSKDNNGQYAWRFNLKIIDEKYSTITANINENNSCLCDTLFIKGNDSDYILPDHRNTITARFKNTKAKVIHGAGHWLHAENPGLFHELAMSFFKGIK
jgi:esterase